MNFVKVYAVMLLAILSVGCTSLDLGRNLPVQDVSHIPQARSMPALAIDWADPLIFIGGSAFVPTEVNASSDLVRALKNSGHFSTVKLGSLPEEISLRITSYVVSPPKSELLPRAILSAITGAIIPASFVLEVNISVIVMNNGITIKRLSYSEEYRTTTGWFAFLFGKSVHNISEVFAAKFATNLLKDIYAEGLLDQSDVSL